MRSLSDSMTYEELREFILKWWEAPTMDAFCNNMNMDKRTASNIATGLRRIGVSLKLMSKSPVKRRFPLTPDQIRGLVRLSLDTKQRINGVNV